MFGSRRRRDARLAPVWARALAVGSNSPSSVGSYDNCSCLGQVVRYRQRARSGTKAYVRWLADDSVTAAWFEGARPAVKAYVLASGGYGHGRHHSEPVFYIGPGSFEVVPAEALGAYTRQQRRLARRSKRHP